MLTLGTGIKHGVGIAVGKCCKAGKLNPVSLARASGTAQGEVEDRATAQSLEDMMRPFGRSEEQEGRRRRSWHANYGNVFDKAPGMRVGFWGPGKGSHPYVFE